METSVRAGLRYKLPPWTSQVNPSLFASPLVERIIDRLGEFAGTPSPPAEASRSRGRSVDRETRGATTTDLAMA
jgi:hypothetical protein